MEPHLGLPVQWGVWFSLPHCPFSLCLFPLLMLCLFLSNKIFFRKMEILFISKETLISPTISFVRFWNRYRYDRSWIWKVVGKTSFERKWKEDLKWGKYFPSQFCCEYSLTMCIKIFQGYLTHLMGNGLTVEIQHTFLFKNHGCTLNQLLQPIPEQ